MAVKKKDHENLTDTNIKKVIELLESQKPITKKEACEILNINYNTTRLTAILESYKLKKATEKKHRDAKRGKPISDEEISTIVSSYLTGTNVVDIAKSIYRSASLVSSVIDRLGVPKKVLGDEKRNVAILPDECVAEEFFPGQLAWSAVYHAPCEIIKEVPNSSTTNYEQVYGCKCYNIYVLESLDEVPEFYPNIKVGGFYGSSPAYNLGSLEHLKKYGIKFNV